LPTDRGAAADILLCDDDDDVRGLLGDALKSIGYTVHEADGGEAALRMLDDGLQLDLLVSDYAMPGMNGLETWREAQRLRPDLRFLLITGYAEPLGGADSVLVLRKPFTPDELAQYVARALAS
jgi:CheY-like chemotaxis protein